MKYYYGFEENTRRYIERMTESIMARRFFGRTTQELVNLRANVSRLKTQIAKIQSNELKRKNPEQSIKQAQKKIDKLNKEIESKDDGLLADSIGAYVIDMVEAGTVDYSQQTEIRQIFEALFKPQSANRLIHGLQTLEYVASLSQIPAILTQYGEVVLSILKAPSSTLPNWVRSHLGKSEIKLHDIGVRHIGQEWVDADLDRVATGLLTLFEKVDEVGKETFVNSVVDKYRKLAKTNPDKVREELKKYYQESEFDAIIESLKADVLDDNVRGFALNELADVQPISMMEVPEVYAKAGNLRVFYMYKTFMLKRLDILRNQGYNQIKSGIKTGQPSEIVKGIGRLVWLLFMFTLADSTMDFIKDFIKGKPIETMPEYMFDNFLQTMLLSKYSFENVRAEGVSSLFHNNIALPVSTLDAAGRDIFTLMDEDSERGSYLARRIPWIGDLYFWWVGEGARKIEEGYYDKD